MDGQDFRKEKRIPVNNLPPKYRHFRVLQSSGEDDVVLTVDASVSGFGFISDMPEESYVEGTRIVLQPFGEERPVYAKVVFTKFYGAGTRVGVELLPIGYYKQYKKEILELMKHFGI